MSHAEENTNNITKPANENVTPQPKLNRMDKKSIINSVSRVIKKAERVTWGMVDEIEEIQGPGGPIKKPTGRKIVVIKILLPR